MTGGAGFVGSHLCEKLLENGKRVICLDYFQKEENEKNISSFKNHPNVVIARMNILDESTRDLIKKEGVTKIIHLAAAAGVRASIEDPESYVRNNVDGTVHLLKIAVDAGIKKFVLASSSSVYGVTEEGSFREDQAGIPISPYAASKRCSEIFCENFSVTYGLSCICLRFFTVYGPRGREDMAPLKFTRLIDAKEEIPLYGDGSAMRDFTYITDIVEGIIKALEIDRPFEIVNLGYGNPRSVNELISCISKSLGKEANIRYEEKQKGDVPRTLADITKAKSLLGYKPTISLEEGVEKMVQWFKETIEDEK